MECAERRAVSRPDRPFDLFLQICIFLFVSIRISTDQTCRIFHRNNRDINKEKSNICPLTGGNTGQKQAAREALKSRYERRMNPWKNGDKTGG